MLIPTAGSSPDELTMRSGLGHWHRNMHSTRGRRSGEMIVGTQNAAGWADVSLTSTSIEVSHVSHVAKQKKTVLSLLSLNRSKKRRNFRLGHLSFQIMHLYMLASRVELNIQSDERVRRSHQDARGKASGGCSISI